MNLLSSSGTYQHFSWEIRNFFSLPSEIDYFVQSPEFRFAGEPYCLRLYPRGTPNEDDCSIYVAIVLVRLPTPLPEKKLWYEIGYRSNTGGEFELTRYRCLVESVGGIEFYEKRSQFETRRETFVPGGILTLYCRIRLNEVTVASRQGEETGSQFEMLFLTLLLGAIVPSLCQLNFTGHKLLGLFPSDEKELEFLRHLSEQKHVDAWNLPSGLYEKMSIRVPPEVAEQLEGELKSKGIDFYVMTDNIQKWIDEEREENPPDDAMAGRQTNFQLDVYHTFEAISSYIDSVGTRYPGLAQIQHLGTTFEGNPLKGLKIGSSGANKPAIWIDSGIHAREWVAPATSLYIIEQLLKGYDTDSEIRGLVDTFDWYIFPVMNPDGYIYTWSYNRMWRKNRAPSVFNPFCRGTDPNRNFDASFGGPGTSGDPCSEIYRGPSAFSEAESRAVRDGVIRIGSNLKAFITLHSYSQLWMTPYGTSRENPPHYNEHMKILTAACSAIQNVHGQYYRYGTIANTIYPAAGSSVDWAYAGANVKYSFAVELRDTGRQGFLLSNSQIIPTAEENFAGIKTIAKSIQSEL